MTQFCFRFNSHLLIGKIFFNSDWLNRKPVKSTEQNGHWMAKISKKLIIIAKIANTVLSLIQLLVILRLEFEQRYPDGRLMVRL